MNWLLAVFTDLSTHLVSGHVWLGQRWSLVLNILKFIGAALTGTAGIIGILTETKVADPATPDKKRLTKSGRILLGLGIVGFAIALTSQIVEWIKTGYDAQAAQLQNAATLSEIRKAVTRFETIDLDFTVALPINEPILKAYKDSLDKRLDEIETMNIGVGQVYKGIRVGTKHRDDWGNALISIAADSEAMPTARDGPIGDLIKKIPQIEFYKPPVDPSKNFVRRGDLRLVATAGDLRLEGVLGHDEKVESLAIKWRGMNAPANKWSPTGALISLEELPGAQVVMYFPTIGSKGLTELWNQCTGSAAFYFNYQRVDMKREPVRTRDIYGQTVLSYQFVEDDVKPSR
jgi:hypothetical protein